MPSNDWKGEGAEDPGGEAVGVGAKVRYNPAYSSLLSLLIRIAYHSEKVLGLRDAS